MNEDKLIEIKSALSLLNWDELNNMSVNESHNYFSNKLNEIIDKIAPETEVKLNRKIAIKEKWMTKGLLQSTIKKKKCT